MLNESRLRALVDRWRTHLKTSPFCADELEHELNEPDADEGADESADEDDSADEESNDSESEGEVA